MEYLYPLKLSYATATMLWGGSRLIREWGKKADGEKLAEAWELTVRDDGRMSFIENGELCGMSLGEYIRKYGNSVVSGDYDGRRFPLLIKFIDAEDRLSVQVHPDDAYAKKVENDSGKTEMWYIMDAEPGAEIIYGLKEGITKEAFAAAVKKGDYDSVMKRVGVHPGEAYYIPSGMLHAIGKGILIAEIQQNSDLTYRVYDYNRRGADGKLRQLHVEKALDVTRPFTDEEINNLRYENGGYNDGKCLARGKYFGVYRVNPENTEKMNADSRSFKCILSLGGEAVLSHSGKNYIISRGECWYIPAGMGEFSLSGKADLIIAEL